MFNEIEEDEEEENKHTTKHKRIEMHLSDKHKTKCHISLFRFWWFILFYFFVTPRLIITVHVGNFSEWQRQR